MTRITFSLAMVAALLLAAAPAQAQYYPKAYFSPNGGGADATAELINKAETTIDVAMYSISTSGPIWGALESAVQRGVRVRLILNKGTSSNKKKAASLAGIGVHVFATSRTMHEKFALIDAGQWWRRKLVNGSANWSRGAETRYSENTVVFGRHYHLFYAFQQEFNKLMDVARPASPGAENHTAEVSLRPPSKRTRRYESVVFSGDNSGGSTIVADELIRVMNTAQTKIAVDIAFFNSRQLADALIAIRQAKPNLIMEIMVDMGQYADSKSRVTDLEAAGIDVRYKVYSLAFEHPRSQLQHHKTLIVDERDVVTGSFNWSDTAEQSNYENVITIRGHVRRNEAVVKGFVDEHDRLWEQGRALYDEVLKAMTAPPGDPAYRRYLPIHFDTDYFRGSMALTRPEFQALRSAGWRAGLFDRQPDGKRNVKFSYLDRETRDVYRGKPSGTFLPSNTGMAAVLSGTQ
ncbi:MAG: hypothetical protein JKY65_16545 [Planctomycetes bacterium]|nr:hypothetical protein [Planctomycetota bacterium]